MPPARAQEGVNEIIPTSLTTKTEEIGSKTDKILIPGRLDQVPPDTFSFGPRGDRSCRLLPSVQPGEKPRKTVENGGVTSTGQGGDDAPSVRFPQVKKENSEGRLMLS